MIEGYYRDEGWQFALADPDEDANLERALPEDRRGMRRWRTKEEWLAQGDHATAHNRDGSTVLVLTEALRELPDDAHIVLRRRVFGHPNADPIVRGVDAGATGELVVTFRRSGGPSIRWSAAGGSHRAAIEDAVVALQRLLDDDVLDKLESGTLTEPG